MCSPPNRPQLERQAADARRRARKDGKDAQKKLAGGGSAVQDAVHVRELEREVKGRLLQLRQVNRNKDKMQRSFRNATLAGGKVTPEPPRLATRRSPSVHPPGTYRYRVPEPSGGWVVRPHIEAHGVESSDGIEGLYMEKAAVAGRDPEGRAGPGPAQPRGGGGGLLKRLLLLVMPLARRRRRTDADLLIGGVPYRHYVSAQCNKEHKALQVGCLPTSGAPGGGWRGQGGLRGGNPVTGRGLPPMAAWL